jgi:hypothetical protein
MRERIANVSSSTRNETYAVSRHGDTGVWECSCIGWTRHVPRRIRRQLGTTPARYFRQMRTPVTVTSTRS